MWACVDRHRGHLACGGGCVRSSNRRTHDRKKFTTPPGLIPAGPPMVPRLSGSVKNFYRDPTPSFSGWGVEVEM